MLGLAGGQSGTGIAAPQSANIVNPTTAAQAQEQYGQTQQALAQQQGFVNAVNQANGVGNLQNAFGAQANAAAQAAAGNGLGNQAAAFGAQQALANQLGNAGGLQAQQAALQGFQGIANGTGPNVAQAQLNQATGANVANQAAMMAGQRGANQNVGMLARQAAQQGAATQQQAAGQAATLQAQQQQAALGQMAGIGQGLTGAQAAQQTAMANTAQAQANNQLAAQAAMAGTAATQAGQQAQAIQGLNTAAQGNQGQILQSIGAQNTANANMQSNINSANAGLANTQLQGQQATTGGLLNAAGAGLKSLFAEGGTVKPVLAYNGWPNSEDVPKGQGPWDNPNEAASTTATAPTIASPTIQAPTTATTTGAKSYIGKFLKGALPGQNSQGQGQAQPAQQDPNDSMNWGNPGANALYKSLSSMGNMFGSSGSSASAPAPQAVAGGPMDAGAPNTGLIQPLQNDPTASSETMNAAKGGKVPALLSPGEKYLPPKEAKEVAKGEKSPEKAGKTVPGKPKVPGAKNSYANDTVPAKLEEGGIVIPRSITQGKDAEKRAIAFVRATIAKSKGKLQ